MLRVSVKIVVAVEALLEWPLDKNHAVIPWSQLSSENRTQLYQVCASFEPERFIHWFENDLDFTSMGGKFVLSSHHTLPDDKHEEPPTMEFHGSYQATANEHMTDKAASKISSHNRLMEMLAGIFAHYAQAGDDSLSLRSVEFNDPKNDTFLRPTCECASN